MGGWVSEPFDDRFDDNNRFKRDDMNILNLTKIKHSHFNRYDYRFKGLDEHFESC